MKRERKKKKKREKERALRFNPKYPGGGYDEKKEDLYTERDPAGYCRLICEIREEGAYRS